MFLEQMFTVYICKEIQTRSQSTRNLPFMGDISYLQTNSITMQVQA